MENPFRIGDKVTFALSQENIVYEVIGVKGNKLNLAWVSDIHGPNTEWDHFNKYRLVVASPGTDIIQVIFDEYKKSAGMSYAASVLAALLLRLGYEVKTDTTTTFDLVKV